MPYIEFERETDDGETYDVRIPAEWAICSRCSGDGTHVNPNVDGHGISPEEFDEDPDFAEAYFGGVYDVSCGECDGAGKVLAAVLADDEAEWTDDQRAYVEHEQAQADDRAERANELRMGY